MRYVVTWSSSLWNVQQSPTVPWMLPWRSLPSHPRREVSAYQLMLLQKTQGDYWWALVFQPHSKALCNRGPQYSTLPNSYEELGRKFQERGGRIKPSEKPKSSTDNPSVLVRLSYRRDDTFKVGKWTWYKMRFASALIFNLQKQRYRFHT